MLFNLPFGELTWQWNIPIFNRKYIFKRFILCCHVSLLEGFSLLLNPLLLPRSSFHFLLVGGVRFVNPFFKA